jgi:hypothetical protein
MLVLQPSDVPVFILCGGLGTRIKEETEFRPVTLGAGLVRAATAAFAFVTYISGG